MMKSALERKAAAQRLAQGIFTAWSEGRFVPLGDEATAAIRTQLSPDIQRRAHRAIRSLFGDYRGMTFIEAWGPTPGLPSTVYRFRGRFSASDERPEIRVVINRRGKLAGFLIKPWRIEILEES